MTKLLNAVLSSAAAGLLAGCTANATSTDASCGAKPTYSEVATEQEIASLFERWNQSLQSGNPQDVVANYAKTSILLPTMSSKPRLTAEEKADYFEHFLKDEPSGEITVRQIQIGPDIAVDTGHYTFSFAKTGAQVQARYSFVYRKFGNQWLIISHHSSALPEK